MSKEFDHFRKESVYLAFEINVYIISLYTITSRRFTPMNHIKIKQNFQTTSVRL